MNKRQAIAVAAGLVTAMMAGVVALSLGRGIVGTKGAVASTAVPKPIVKTITQVITVKKHRPAQAAPAQTITVVRRDPVGAVSSSSSSVPSGERERSDDSGREHDGGPRGGD
jgi:hypothetical protein